MSDANSAPAGAGGAPDRSTKDTWLHKAIGVHPGALVRRQAASPGADASAPATGLGPAGSDKQSQQFRAAMQQQLAAIDGHLAYTAVHAEAAKHAPMAAKRETITNSYQATLAKIDPEDESRAKGSIDAAVGAAKTLVAQIAQFRSEVEKAFNDWQKRQPKYDEAANQVDEMQSWGHPKSPQLQVSIDGVTTLLDSRSYAEACAAFDKLLPEVQPVHEDYLKQKAAQVQYEPARSALDPRLAAASASNFRKLEPMKQPFSPATADMDTAVGEMNYLHALEIEKGVETKVAEYEKALAELEQQKQDFEAEKTKLTPGLEAAKAAHPYKKLDPMRQSLEKTESQMNQSADAEDFVAALGHVEQLDAEAQDYVKAVAQIEQEKSAYEAALAAIEARLTVAGNSSFKKLEPAQAEISDLHAKTDAAANDENYVTALDDVQQLGRQLDAYEQSLQQLSDQKKQYEDEMGVLQPKLDEAAQAPQHKKLDSMMQELNTGQGDVSQKAQAEDFEGATRAANDLKAKVDVYLESVAGLEEQMKNYEAAAAKVTERADGAKQSTFKPLATMEADIADGQTQMESMAAEEDYVGALDQANQLSAKLDVYDQALAELKAHKQAYEEARNALQPDLDRIKALPRPKLSPQAQQVTDALAAVDAAVTDENYESAEKLVGDLKGKIDAYNVAAADLDAKRQANANAFSKVLTHLDEVKNLFAKAKEELPELIENLRSDVDQLTQSEDYDESMKKIDALEKELDADAQLIRDRAEKVKTAIANVVVKARGYLDGHRIEIANGMSTFKDQASVQIDGLASEASSVAGWTTFVSSIAVVAGAVIGTAFPPATGFALTVAFVSGVANAGAQSSDDQSKDEAAAAIQAMKQDLAKFSAAVSNQANQAIDKVINSLGARLTDLAATDQSVYQLLASSGEKDQAEVIVRLDIPDPAKNSCQGALLKRLMSEFGGWLAKEKALMGKTKYERLVAENVLDDPSHKELEKKIKAGQAAGASQGDQMGRDRQGN